MTTKTDDAYQSLITHLANCDDNKQIDAVLTALLTDKERQEIGNRIRIFDLLEQGTTQREIADNLGVGIATVSRGAKALQKHDISDLLTTHRQTQD